MQNRNVIVITQHAKDRFYQRIVSGYESKDKISRLIQKSWSTAVVTGFGEKGRIVWAVTAPYECRFVTVFDKDQHMLLTVLWPDSFFKQTKTKDTSNQKIYAVDALKKEIVSLKDELFILDNKTYTGTDFRSKDPYKEILKYELNVLNIEYYSLLDRIFREEQQMKIDFYEKSFKMLNAYLNNKPDIEGCKEFVDDIVSHL